MEIGGADVFFEKVPPSREAVFEAVRQFWPDLIIEDPDVLPFYSDEFFLYPNEAAKAKWDDEGLDEGNDAEMIYVIFQEQSFTVVIDSGRTLLPIAEAIGNLV